jgi:C_GCAxxG_C_C family probable redox protein
MGMAGKTQEEWVQEAFESAKNYFKQGLNCSECILQTTLDLNDIDLQPEVLSLASGFGGGMGDTKNTCGAITGAVLALGAVKGRRNPQAKETVKERITEIRESYIPFAEMIKEMEDKYGTLICSELSAPHGEFEGKTRKRNCMQMIGDCAAITQKYIMK